MRVLDGVSMVALVESLKPEEIGRGAGGGRAALALPGEGGCVVGGGKYARRLGKRKRDGEVMLGDGANQFQVGVGQASTGIGEGEDCISDVRWERLAPKVAVGGRRRTSKAEVSDESMAGGGGRHVQGVACG